MNHLSTILLTYAGLLACGPALSAQTTAPGRIEPDVTKLTVHPMPATRPALQYKLLPDVTDQTPGNAAALYLLAARLGPDQKAAMELLQNAIDKYREMPLDQLAHGDLEKALEPFATRLRYVEMAARREDATFDFTLREEGAAALLPYLNDVRVTAGLLGLRARLQIARHDWAGATHTLQTGFSMSRQLNNHAVLVQGLIEVGMADLLLRQMQEWGTQPGAPNLYWALSDLPQPFVDLHAISQWERAMPYLTFPELAHAATRALSAEEWRAVIRSLDRLKNLGYAPSGSNETRERVTISWLVASTYSRAKDSLISEGMPKDQVEAMTVDQVVGMYFFRQYQTAADDAWKAWELPFWQSADQMPANDPGEWDRRRQREEDNPLMLMLPMVRNARFQFARLDRQICVLRTIEALRDYAARHDGRPPASIDDVKDLPIPLDPLTGKQFPYRLKGDAAVIEPVASRGLPEIFELTFTR